MCEMTEQKSKAGGFYLMGIGFAIAAVGAVFVWLMWSSYAQVQETKSWEEMPCEITVSDINTRSAEHISMEYSWKVEYKFTVEGKVLTSKFHTPRGIKWTSDQGRIKAMIDAYPVGKKTVCYVNLDNTKQVILEHDSQAALYSIWFPMLFVVGGLGIMWSAIRGMKLIPC